MEANVFIKIDYKKDRPNPSQLFEAMSLYIAAYEQFGQILAKSIDVKQEFRFNLEDIQISSIKAKLIQSPGIIHDFLLTEWLLQVQNYLNSYSKLMRQRLKNKLIN